MERILAHFNLSEKDFLGEGTESRVYRLSEGRVLRVLKSAKPEEIALREAFFALINRYDYSVSVPEIFDGGDYEGIPYSIEKYIPGKSLNLLLPELLLEARRHALNNYVQAALSFRDAEYPELPFGEVYGTKPITADSWGDYLVKRMESVLKDMKETLMSEVPDLERVLDYFYREVKRFETVSTKTLVHGDYYPANVMVGPDNMVTGVIDFSGLTVIGDPDLDIAAAHIFLDTDEEKAMVQEQVEKLLGDNLWKLTFYEVYYLLIFSNSAEFNAPIYEWCLETLRRYAKGDLQLVPALV